MATCIECGFDRWDGESVHDYAGRASTRLKCYGPKTWRKPSGLAPLPRLKPEPESEPKGVHARAQARVANAVRDAIDATDLPDFEKAAPAKPAKMSEEEFNRRFCEDDSPEYDAGAAVLDALKKTGAIKPASALIGVTPSASAKARRAVLRQSRALAKAASRPKTKASRRSS